MNEAHNQRDEEKTHCRAIVMPCYQTLHDTKEPVKLFLVHTMLLVGSIWKNKSG
jgi:hypothetical protein